MLTAVFAGVPLALGLAVAALPVVLVPIALAAKRPAAVARAFLFGWLLGILLAGALVMALADILVLPSGNVVWFSYVKIVLGLLLVTLAVRRWAGRPRAGQDPPVPGWMAGIDAMSAGKAFGLALLLATLNPKNLALVAAGATTIAQATPVPGQQGVALRVFAIVGSVGVGAPAVVTTVLGDRADEVLTAADRWMTSRSTVIVAVVLLVLGVVLAINGFAGL
jgi:Sap, sulfolipid-1-addressing protein